MADIEKVIKGVECCQNPTERGITCECVDCPYEQGHTSKCRVILKIDVLELLKEYKQLQSLAVGYGLTTCGNCKHINNCKTFDNVRHAGFDWFCADGERKE